MNISIPFIRGSFAALSVFIGAAVGLASAQENTLAAHLFIGIFGGLLFAGCLIGLEQLAKNSLSLRGFNVLCIGVFFGILLGNAIQSLLASILINTGFSLQTEVNALMNTVIYLSSTYVAVILTAQASQEIYVSVPFIRFKPTAPAKKDILLDSSVLQDPRLIDLAVSGLLDDHAILPRFAVVDLQDISEESEDENCRIRARRSLEVISKLESLPDLHLRYTDADFPEIKDPVGRLTRLARHLDANLLTADISRIQQAAIEGVKIINIHSLSNALKPLTQTGEYMSIKIQRYGKEARQGVGYLEDGTMVVVNGGASFIGETIRAQVLSVKHTSSGRMIFCNALESDQDYEGGVPAAAACDSLKESEHLAKRFYS